MKIEENEEWNRPTTWKQSAKNRGQNSPVKIPDGIDRTIQRGGRNQPQRRKKERKKIEKESHRYNRK